mgnify:FL=1
MKPEALGGLTGLGTQPGRTFTVQPENAEPTLAANDSLKVDDRFELIYKEHRCAGEQISDARKRTPSR